MTESVKRITIRDYKGIQGEIVLEPEGKHLVVIAGPNGAGKSSLIDAVTEVFDPKGTKLTPRPIHEGADSAEVEVETDGFRLTRTWKKNGPGTLSVRAADGAKYGSGKEIVAKLVGSGLFDPSAFLLRRPEDQKRDLLNLVDLPFDLDEVNRREAGLREDRKLAKRRADELTARAKGLPDGERGVEQSANELIERIDRATQAKREFLAAKSNVELLAAQIAELTAKAEAEAARIEKLSAKPIEDVDALKAQLDSLESHNASVREYEAKATALAEAEAAANDRDSLEAQLAELSEQKIAGLAAAKFPVEGLGFDDDGITFDGVPFSQLNTAAQEYVAFALATASDRELKLVISKHGDLLDDDSLARLRKLAEDRGFLVLMERDRNRADASVVIKDGQIA